MSIAYVILILLVAYQVKHFVADYLLQGEYMLGKFKPGWGFFWPLIAHVEVHACLTGVITASVFDVFDVPMTGHSIFVLFLIQFFDAVVHFFMDRIKASPKYMGRWKPVTAAEYVDAKSTISSPWYDKQPNVIQAAKDKLRGNKLFWWALGFDQMIHHLTHYACIYATLHFMGLL